MKKYFLRTILVFIIVFAAVLLLSLLIYSHTSNKLREQYAVETITDINQQTSLAIDYRLNNDYNRFVQFLEDYSTLNELNDNKSELNLSGVGIIGFVEVTADEFITAERSYFYRTSFQQSQYHLQNIAFYRLSDALEDSSDTTEYCFFRAGNIGCYFLADPYLKPLLSLVQSPDNLYFVTNADGYIGYRENDKIGTDLFTDFLADESSSVKLSIESKVNTKTPGHVRVKVLGEINYLIFESLENSDTFIMQSFPKAALYTEVAFFSGPLFYTLGAVAVCFLIFMAYAFYYLNKKNNDIEFSKYRYYYSKPYIIKISNKGKIKKFNKKCTETFKNPQDYTSIEDFKTVKECIDLMEDIRKQEPFTIAFESVTEEREYLRLIPVRITGGYFLMGENITLQQKDLEYHRNMALYHGITNLPNKNYLGIKLQDLFSNKDFLSRKNVLVAVEVVSFKNINRLFGQKIGEAALVAVAKIINSSFGKNNAILYHVETATYMILFLDLDKYSDAFAWGEKLTVAFEKPLDVSGNLFNIKLKIGVFEIDTNRYTNVNPVSSYDNAVLALKRAKESRRSNVFVYDIGMGQVFTRTQAMEIDMVAGIKNKEFRIFYQPQLNTMKNQIIGLESLLRWDNPKYELDSPALFIELAEQNNMILEIGRFVINETFKSAKEWEKYKIRININISPVQILQSGFVYELTSAFDRFKLKKNSIVIEITETMMMESFDSIIEKLFILKKHGFMIHLDNFGTGYSSMLYLKDLPIDGISISRDFIKNIESDKHARTIISKIISLANSLNIEIVAEGVETDKQKAFLNKNGCFIIQGFLISKAVEKQNVIKLLEHYNKKSNTKLEDIDYYDFLR